MYDYICILHLHALTCVGSLFDTVNAVHDKVEAKERQKLSKAHVGQWSCMYSKMFVVILCRL